MTLWRVLTVFFGLLVTAPTVILNANGYNIAFWVDEEADVDETTASLVPDQIIPPRDRPPVQALFATDTLTDARIIKITEVVSAEALLQTGEVAPNETLLPLYAAARAPARLIRYCADVIAAIGKACDVVHTETHENQSGKHELTGHLAFIPAFDTGNPFDMADGALVEASIDLPYVGDLQPANDADTRKAAMEQVMALCTKLRDTVGNCAVTQVAFTVHELWITDLEALPAGTNPQRLGVQARFAVFVDKTGLDETGLQALLHDMTALG